MKAIIKKPISITVYEYRDKYRVEMYHYNCKTESPMYLREAKEFQEEADMITYTNKLKEKYEVKDFLRHLKDDEIEYTPHHRFQTFEWTPPELKDVMDNYFLRTYGYHVESSIAFDHYNGNFRVEFDVSEDFGEYDEFFDAVMEDFTYAEEKERMYSMEWQQIFERLLHDIVGEKLCFIRPVDQSVYAHGESTWSHDSNPAYFFFQ